MKNDDKKRIEELDQLIQAYIKRLDEAEQKAERNYRIHNISLEYLQENNVPVELVAGLEPDNILDMIMNEDDRFSLLEIVENEKLVSSMRKLQELDISILTLRYKQSLLIREISKAVNRDQGTIRRHLESARKHLKKSMTDKEE